MLTESAKNNFVSRAEGKLLGAVKGFSFDFRKKLVLDIGSSTGGFTELALKLGARKVIAVEKGTRQMKAPLRYDPRVELHEKTDIFDCSYRGHSAVSIEVPQVVMADVSFISLRNVLKFAKYNLADFKTDFLVMLKPQFEARGDQLVRGVVKNEKIRREIIREFEEFLKQNGFVVLKKRDNEVAGKNGNVERFYWLRLAKKA